MEKVAEDAIVKDIDNIGKKETNEEGEKETKEEGEKEKDQGGIFGAFKTTELGLEILVKNKKNKAINIIVEDQIPISNIEEIEVKLLDKSKADLDEATGKLTWKYELKAGESEKHIIRYEVKYPKKNTISNL